MPERLPPLRTLQIFEAAARHLSYSRAADELSLTQSAVSHQIKGLEAWLQTKLFHRQGRSMLLTDHGQRLYAYVRNGLECFGKAVAQLRADARPEIINVSATPSISASWLLPRLPDFYRRHPDMDVNLRATNALADFEHEDVDLALRYGHGDWPGLSANKFLSVDLFPVCSPRYRGGKLPQTASELLDGVLLHYTYGTSWEEWFKSANLTLAGPLRGPRFDDYGLAVQAAADGQGVLLGRDALVTKELANRQLVRLLRGQPAQKAFDYYIVHRGESALRPKVRLFRDWLLEQVAKSSG